MRYVVIVLLLGYAFVDHADSLIKVRKVTTDSKAPQNVQNPNTHRDVYYRRGTMRRKESLGSGTTPILVEVVNCEQRTGYLIDLNAREYRSYNVVKFMSDAQIDEYLTKNPQNAVQIESKTIDTGERKEFFHHPAKHLITTIKRKSDEGSDGGEEIIDGWYIDHELADNHCAPDFTLASPQYVLGTALVQYPKFPQFHHTGPLPAGLAVLLTRIIKEGKSGRIFTLNETIEELSDGPISPSLFAPPAGFQENQRLLR